MDQVAMMHNLGANCLENSKDVTLGNLEDQKFAHAIQNVIGATG